MLPRTFLRSCLVLSMMLPVSALSIVSTEGVASADIADPPRSPAERRAPSSTEKTAPEPEGTGSDKRADPSGRDREPTAPAREPSETHRAGDTPFGATSPFLSLTLLTMFAAAGLWIGRNGARPSITAKAS